MMIFDDLKHAQRERLIFLDQCLTWRGIANRRDLVDRFGISQAQAALDFKAYIEHAGDTAPVYDPKLKAYLPAPKHRPLADGDLMEAFESVLDIPEKSLPSSLPLPQCSTPAPVISHLYKAIRTQQAICVRYTSMTTGHHEALWLAPVRFTSDGLVVHLRAYCFKHHAYREYLPVRIGLDSTFELRPLESALPEDTDWQTVIRIYLQPRTGLNEDQRKAVRIEYGFERQYLCVEIRKALEFYFDRRWGLDQPGSRLERIENPG